MCISSSFLDTRNGLKNCILEEYETLLVVLQKKLEELLSHRIGQRDVPYIAVVEDEIRDVELAISLLRGLEKERGYRPRRSTILSRPDFYLDVD